MLFTVNDQTGAITVDEWAEEAYFSYEFLDQANQAIMRTDGNNIWIKVANGNALYYIVDQQPEIRRVRGKLIGGNIDASDLSDR